MLFKLYNTILSQTVVVGVAVGVVVGVVVAVIVGVW